MENHAMYGAATSKLQLGSPVHCCRGAFRPNWADEDIPLAVTAFLPTTTTCGTKKRTGDRLFDTGEGGGTTTPQETTMQQLDHSNHLGAC